MSRPTQPSRVLAMLRSAGAAGLTQLDVISPSDGGPPIMALSQRIGDLVRAGRDIRSKRERTAAGATVSRYFLASERMRGTVPGTPLPTSCKTPEAQPEDEPLVHSTRSRPESRA